MPVTGEKAKSEGWSSPKTEGPGPPNSVSPMTSG